VLKENQTLRAIFVQASTNTKVQFVLGYTKGDGRKRTGRHFTGGAEKLALNQLIFPKNKQFALKLTCLV